MHHGHQGEQAVTTPEPFVDPTLHDGHVGGVLLQHELDAFNAQGHVARLVRLRREAKRHGGNVAVVCSTRHERHEQQVGQYVFKGKAHSGQELERTTAEGIFKEGLGHGQIPHVVEPVVGRVHAIEVLVVVRDGMRFGLEVTQFINGLHLSGDTRTCTCELTTHVLKTTVGVVLQRCHTLNEQFQSIDVARITDTQLTIVLRKGVDHRVKFLVLFALVFPIRVHGQTERVFPFVPVMDLDAFVLVIGKHLVHGLVGGVPMQAARHRSVAVFQT